MKLTVFQHGDDPDVDPLHAEFVAPGGTLGRDADNHLALPDPTRAICRVQAAIRITDADAAFLENLSSMSTVSVNGRPVAQGQEVPLHPGDALRIGAYVLRAEPAADAPPLPVTAAAAAAAPAAAAPAAAPAAHAPDDDIFGDLIGPGTLPVGAAPDVSVHPFDLESAQTRNPHDPLRHLPRGDATITRADTDPLALFDIPDDASPSIFSDESPSTLSGHDPLAEHRSHPVDEALHGERARQDSRAASDHVREIGGFMRPASVKRPPNDKDR